MLDCALRACLAWCGRCSVVAPLPPISAPASALGRSALVPHARAVEGEPMDRATPRYVRVTLAIALGLVLIALVAFGVALVSSDVSWWAKILGLIGLVAAAVMGTTRLVIASRPYGNPPQE